MSSAIWCACVRQRAICSVCTLQAHLRGAGRVPARTARPPLQARGAAAEPGERHRAAPATATPPASRSRASRANSRAAHSAGSVPGCSTARKKTMSRSTSRFRHHRTIRTSARTPSGFRSGRTARFSTRRIRRRSIRTFIRSISRARRGAILCHSMCVCGYPCRRRSGGPLPPRIVLMVAPDVLTMRRSKPGNNDERPAACV